jgi:hypothetical protein
VRKRSIKNIVDRINSLQRRLILNLECGHNISVTEAELDKHPFLRSQLEELREYDCPLCPDAPKIPEPPHVRPVFE